MRSVYMRNFTDNFCNFNTNSKLIQCIYWVKEAFIVFVNSFPKLACEEHSLVKFYL